MKRVPVWLRALIPAVVILIWLGVGGPYFGKVGEVSSNDQTTFLPASADATKVQKLLVNFTDSKSLPAIVLFVRAGGLTGADVSYVSQAVIRITATRGGQLGSVSRDPVEGWHGA